MSEPALATSLANPSLALRAPPRAARALAWKEWIEHRWRFALGTIVLSTLLGGMLRAQIIPFHEAAILIYWPVGTILTVFLAMGPIATEKAGSTWEFLVAHPVPRYRILLAKWRTGIIQLVAMMFISGLAGVIAMWSRGFYGRVTLWQMGTAEDQVSVRRWLDLVTGHPALWLASLVLVATVTLACWYSFLFVLLLRARNEFEAALAGAMLTIAIHVWLLHLVARGLWSIANTGAVAQVVAGFNPFAEFVVLINPSYLVWIVAMIPVHAALWIGLPLLFLRTRR